jgi:uncharacterized protein YlzI (FlbEa/FlbD family)
MMFIEVKCKNGLKYAFNVEHIAAIYECEDGTTVIKLSNGDNYPTETKYEEIMSAFVKKSCEW